MFTMWIQSSLTGKKTIQSKSGVRILQEATDDQEDEEKEMEFSARVLSHSSKEIEFQLEFQNAHLISETFEYDQFALRVSKAYLFRSAKSFKTISDDCQKENCYVYFEKTIPP